MRLRDTHTFRHPASNPSVSLSGWISPVEISARHCIVLELQLSAARGGRTNVGINIGKSDFDVLLSAMAEVDRGTTLLAICSTLARINEGLSRKEKEAIKRQLEFTEPWYKRKNP